MSYVSFHHLDGCFIGQAEKIKENTLAAYTQLEIISSSSDSKLGTFIEDIQDLICFANKNCKDILKQCEIYKPYTHPSFEDYLKYTHFIKSPQEESTQALKEQYHTTYIHDIRIKRSTTEEINQLTQMGAICEVLNKKINLVVDRLLTINPNAKVERVDENIFKNIPNDLKTYWQCPRLMKKKSDDFELPALQTELQQSTRSADNTQQESSTPAYWITTNFDLKSGNTLFIRGSGSNLNWEKGTQMTYREGKWCYPVSLSQDETLEFKFCINDREWETGTNHTYTFAELSLLDKGVVDESKTPELEIEAKF